MLMVTAFIVSAVLGQTQPQYTTQAAPTYTYIQPVQETLGAEEVVPCRVQKILTGTNAGQYHVIQVLNQTPVQQVSVTTETAKTDVKPKAVDLAELELEMLMAEVGPVGEKVGNEYLGSLKTTEIIGYGQCEAREILSGPEKGKWRVIRQLLPPGDLYGFTNWLNGVRASYGLSAVGHDPNLSNWAAENNNHQAARGMGHYVMGPARRQNSAMGAGFPGAMWMASPAHRAALLDPTISWIGIAAAGAFWTFNAN